MDPVVQLMQRDSVSGAMAWLERGYYDLVVAEAEEEEEEDGGVLDAEELPSDESYEVITEENPQEAEDSGPQEADEASDESSEEVFASWEHFE